MYNVQESPARPEVPEVSSAAGSESAVRAPAVDRAIAGLGCHANRWSRLLELVGPAQTEGVSGPDMLNCGSCDVNHFVL